MEVAWHQSDSVVLLLLFSLHRCMSWKTRPVAAPATLDRTDTFTAMGILQQRLVAMKDKGHYLGMLIADLSLSNRASNTVFHNMIKTV